MALARDASVKAESQRPLSASMRMVGIAVPVYPCRAPHGATGLRSEASQASDRTDALAAIAAPRPRPISTRRARER